MAVKSDKVKRSREEWWDLGRNIIGLANEIVRIDGEFIPVWYAENTKKAGK